MGKGLRAAERHHARRVAAGISDDQKAIAALGAKLFAALAEVRALRAERDALKADHIGRVMSVPCCDEQRALRARVAELERLGNAMADATVSTAHEKFDAWRKAVRG